MKWPTQSHVTLTVGSSHSKLPPCLVWYPKVSCKWRHNIFKLSRDLTRSHDQRTKWLHGWELLVACDHSHKFGNHRHCDSELLWHLWRVMPLSGWKTFRVSDHLFIFGCNWSSASGDAMYLICHVTSKDLIHEGLTGSSGKVWWLYTLW